jgi:NADP-dependent 3-hydroxy acid dehydrogenase YdfG
MGGSVARTALAHGDKVTAVGRTVENSIEQMRGWHENCQGLLCDVRVRETVDAVIKQSVKHWGKVDIIVK